MSLATDHPKIVLINLPSPWLTTDRDFAPLGILYLASHLKKYGVNFQVCDLASLPYDKWFIPMGDVYGISFTTPQAFLAIKLAKKLKNRQEDAFLVAGGIHPTILPERTLDNSLFDCVVIGDGEETLLEIAKGTSLREISGISYKSESGKIIHNNPRNYTICLDKLDFPARDQVDILSYHKIQSTMWLGDSESLNEGSLITSRGCPYKCSYCVQLKNHKVRYRSVGNILSEIEYLIKMYKCDRLFFLDEALFIDDTRLEDLCEGLKKFKIKWHCQSRVDLVSKDKCKLMKESGCIGITFGIESGSDFILAMNRKGHTVSQTLEGVDSVKSVDMKVRGQLVLGLPGENEKSVNETKKLINTLAVDSWALHIFVPFPGCDIWENPNKYNFQFDKNTDFSEFHTIGKPGKWRKIINSDPEQVSHIRRWSKELLNLIGSKNVFMFCPDWKIL